MDTNLADLMYNIVANYADKPVGELRKLASSDGDGKECGGWTRSECLCKYIRDSLGYEPIKDTDDE